MEHSLGLKAEAKNPVNPLSVEDFLYSLARTPTPRRFDKRHQRLLLGKPRLSRTRANVDPNANRVDRVGAVSPKYTQAPASLFGLPSDDHHCQHPPESLQSSVNLEQTIRIAQVALLNPVVDTNNRKEANGGTDGEYPGADQSSRVSVHGKDGPVESLIYAKHNGHQSSFSSPAEHNHTETPGAGHLEQGFVALLNRPTPPPKKKLQQAVRKKHPEKEAVDHGKHLKHQKSRTSPSIPRRLPVDELELVADRVQNYLNSDSDGRSDNLREI